MGMYLEGVCSSRRCVGMYFLGGVWVCTWKVYVLTSGRCVGMYFLRGVWVCTF